MSVISPMQQLTINDAAMSPGYALRVGVRRKLASNLPSCRLAGVECIPVVVETLGGWCQEAISTIRSIGQALGYRTNNHEPIDLSTKHLYGRLAMALWRGNASLWMRRQPSFPPSVDGLISIDLYV